MNFNCYVCNREVPLDLKNSHHKIPRSAGGSDGPPNEIGLCNGCHDTLHAIAYMLQNPKRAGRVSDVLRQTFATHGAQQRCMDLSQLVVKYNVLKKDGHLPDQEEIEEQLVIKLPAKYKKALQIMANERTNPKSRRRVGMIPYVRAILIDHVRKNFPGL